MNTALPQAAQSTTEDNSTRYLDVADRIGARLCRDAIWHGDRCNWIGPSMEYVGHSWQVVHRALGANVYSGTAGIALFLAELHALVPQQPIEKAAKAAFRNALATRNRQESPLDSGYYAGSMGLAHVAEKFAVLFNEDIWHSEAEKIIAELLANSPEPQGIDVIAGSAGVIPVMLQLQASTESEPLLQFAIRHGEYLLSCAESTEHGCSWDTLPGATHRHLTGYAHGAAGVAIALLELHKVTGDDRYLEAARQGFQYEQNSFDTEQQNWPDFRDHASLGLSAETSICAVAWCHGAAGIGLSRIRAYQLLGEDDLLQQAYAAINTTRRLLSNAVQTTGFDFSYCHGVIGNADMLLTADQTLGINDNQQFLQQLALWGISSYEDAGIDWPCGVPGAGESPGLFLGLAGIGHFLLRLTSNRVASVLLLPGS